MGMPETAALLRKARASAEAGSPAVVVTLVRGSGLGQKVLVTSDAVEGSLGDASLNEAALAMGRNALDGGASGLQPLSGDVDVFIDVFSVRPLLLLIGAVHVAQALVQLAEPLGFRIVVADARESLATRERFPTVDELVVAWPDEAYEKLEITPSTAIVILTHDPKFDEPAILGALKTGAGYIGAVGSRKTNADRRVRLREAGATDEEIDRVHGPIGLNIGGRSPEEMAISILAEIIAVRNGRSGGSLRTTAGNIRAEG